MADTVKEFCLYGKRLKQKDLLSIVNCKHLKMGKNILKSAKTVPNRGHPRNKKKFTSKMSESGFSAQELPPNKNG